MKILGIIAMILAIVSLLLPFGTYLTILCALFIAFSAGPGLTFAGVALGINLINIIFLSPLLWAMGVASGGIVLVVIGAQIVAGIVLAILHQSWKKKQPLPETSN